MGMFEKQNKRNKSRKMHMDMETQLNEIKS